MIYFALNCNYTRPPPPAGTVHDRLILCSSEYKNILVRNKKMNVLVFMARSYAICVTTQHFILLRRKLYSECVAGWASN